MEICQGEYRVKLLSADDWADLRAIRLHALQTNPDVFTSKYEVESAYSEQDWRDWITKKGQAFFALFHQDKIIGLTGIITCANNPAGSDAILIASFIDKDYRGKSLSRLLYSARIEWAKSQSQFDRILVSHRASNIASAKANQAFGFKKIGAENQVWPDGAHEDKIIYELKRENFPKLN